MRIEARFDQKGEAKHPVAVVLRQEMKYVKRIEALLIETGRSVIKSQDKAGRGNGNRSKFSLSTMMRSFGLPTRITRGGDTLIPSYQFEGFGNTALSSEMRVVVLLEQIHAQGFQNVY